MATGAQQPTTPWAKLPTRLEKPFRRRCLASAATLTGFFADLQQKSSIDSPLDAAISKQQPAYILCTH
jgi:hypothetical protein